MGNGRSARDAVRILSVCALLGVSAGACSSPATVDSSAAPGAVAEEVATPEPVEGVEITDEGDPGAFFGTKGVEITIKNLKSEPLYAWLRRTGDVRTLKQNESTTFQGESSFGDDVEIKVTWRSDGGAGGSAGDIDGKNESVGYPKVSMDWDEKRYGAWFEVNENFTKTNKLDGKDTKVSVTRISDSSDYKRFTVEIS